MLQPGEEFPQARWGGVNQVSKGGRPNIWGSDGADTLDAAINIIMSRVAKSGECGAAETVLYVRRVGHSDSSQAPETLRIEHCDAKFGLSSADVDRVRQALAECTVAQPLDVFVTFDAA